MRARLFLIAVFLIFLNLHFVLADSAANITKEEQAKFCLSDSINILTNLQAENFSIQRVNDTLIGAEHLYQAQLSVKLQRKPTDFSLTISKCQEIQNLSDMAFELRDEVTALGQTYNNSYVRGMNVSGIEFIFTQIKDEMQSERYEKVKPLIDKGYEEITNARASATTLNIFYKATTQGIKTFFVDNWITITATILILLILYVIFRKPIWRYFINRKITQLEIRKKTLKELIMNTQKDYFQFGKISEGIYNIKTKKFAELIRDIDRQVPLLQEELMKLGRKKAEEREDGENREEREQINPSVRKIKFKKTNKIKKKSKAGKKHAR